MGFIITFIIILGISRSSFGQQKTDTIVTSDQSNKADLSRDTTIYTTVDTIASFPGGRQAWIKHIKRI